MRARLLLAAAALAAFGASLGSGFHFDDYAIFDGASLASASRWSAAFSLRQTRPLTYLSFCLNRALGGGDPLGYHLVNLALHLAAALLAYECLSRLMDRRAAWLAAAVFAAHPIQAEAVDYIWARAIVLAAVFVFAALLAWIAGRPWLTGALFALALLSKEECVAFPLALWLVEARLIPKPASVRRFRPWAPLAAMLALSFAAGLRTVYAAATTPGSQAGPQAGITPARYLLAQGAVLWRYLRLFAVPYGFTVDPEVQVPPVWLSVAAWLAVAAGLAAAWRWRRDLAVWLAVALLFLLPSSSIFPAADLAADRRMYLPVLPMAAAAAILLSRFGRRLLPAIAAPLMTAVVLLSIGRTQVWGSDESLWREAVRRAPDKVRPRIQLSRSVGTGEALALLEEARRIAPEDPAVAAETGRVLLAAGRAGEALAQFGRALALAPRDANNYNNRGVALQALGQTGAARQDFERALELDPGLDAARENLRKSAP